MPNEPLDLDAIEARANAATPGPWKAARRGGIHPTVFADDDGAVASVAVARRRGPERTTADVRFIAHARTDIPALIAHVREHEQEIAKLKEELDEEIDHNARLSAKLDETKHNCACDYDERGAVCLVHTRPVREARERIAALEAERDELRKKIADGRYVVPDDYIHIVFGRKE